MPRLRRLSGKEVIAILEQLGFQLHRTRGSHHQMRRVLDNAVQTVVVPVHGNKPLAIGTLRSIYRQLCMSISQEEARPLFYAD